MLDDQGGGESGVVGLGGDDCCLMLQRFRSVC